MGQSKDPRRKPTPRTRTGSTKAAADPRQKRTRLVAIGLIFLLLVGVAITALSSTLGTNEPETAPPVDALPTTGPLAVTIPGDLDGDDKITEEERTEVETTTQTAADLTTSAVGPEVAKTASSMLVTPAGQDWWDLVAAQTSYARLWEMPAPEHVNWYALTWSHRTTALASKRDASMYPAVHIAFPTRNDAAMWAASASDTESGATLLLDFTYRDSVVTVAPAGTNLNREPLPKRLGDIKDETLDSGYWSIDYGRQIRDSLRDAPAMWQPAFRKYWENLGLMNLRWSAVSRDPGRWVGKATGFNPDKPSLEDAIGYVNATMTRDGNPQASTIAMMMRVVKDGVTFGPDYMDPQEKPVDPDLIFSQMVGIHTFMVTGSSTQSTKVGYLEQWIKDGVMTVVPRPPAPPREGTAPLPPPDVTVPDGETPLPSPSIPSEPEYTVEGTPSDGKG